MKNLQIAGLTIPVEITGNGPRVPIHGNDDWRTPLAWLISRWQNVPMPELVGAIERREPFDGGGITVHNASSANWRTRDVWQEKTGTPAGDDAVVISAIPVRDSMLIPRAVLLELMHAIEGMKDEPYVPPAPRLWLFRIDESSPIATEADRLVMCDMEKRAAAYDACLSDDMLVPTKQNMLWEIYQSGLLGADREDPRKRKALTDWGLTHLLGWMDRAEMARAYYRSRYREQFDCPPAPKGLEEGAVSLDWFRRDDAANGVPPHAHPFEWLALWEHVLVEQAPDPELLHGEILSHSGGVWHRLIWHRDLHQPAVFRVERHERSKNGDR